MKNTRKNTKKRTFNWATLLAILSGATSFLGFFVMVGSGGSLHLGTLTSRDATLLMLLGLSMMVVGIFVIGLLDSYGYIECCIDDEDEEIEEDDFPCEVEDLIGAMAYNKKYRSWMTIVDYKNDENWVFVLCSNTGRPESTPVRTHEFILDYDWTI